MIQAASRDLWAEHSTRVLKSAVLLMAISAVVWLSYEFWRLIWQTGEMGAIDLRQRHYEMQAWFAGKPVYGEIVTAVYPPASYVILWPMILWTIILFYRIRRRAALLLLPYMTWVSFAFVLNYYIWRLNS